MADTGAEQCCKISHACSLLESGLQYTVIFGYSYTNIHYCICIRICISIYSVYNIQTAWRQVLSSFVKFTMHSRAPIPLYILGRFCSYMNIHYTPTLQNIHYTTYIPTLAGCYCIPVSIMQPPSAIDPNIRSARMRAICRICESVESTDPATQQNGRWLRCGTESMRLNRLHVGSIDQIEG